jgi:SAM-dependent methyltransferase
MNIVLITRDRPELTIQTINSLRDNAVNYAAHSLAIVFDGTSEDAEEFFNNELAGIGSLKENEQILWTGKQLGVGGAKNYGARVGIFPYLNNKPTLLMFSDNDMYYLPRWDEKLLRATRTIGNSSFPWQIGGWKHPFHSGIRVDGIGLEVDAVTGNCFVIRYSDWLKYGPFDSNALGPGQSEDYALSQKIKASGGLVAVLEPPVAIHCGIVNSYGEPATGWKEMLDLANSQIEALPPGNEILLVVPEDNPPPATTAQPSPNQSLRLNVGSGQRRFDNAHGWVNVDCVSRPPDQVPDVICDANSLHKEFSPNSADMIVFHHVLEHFGCGEADGILKSAWEILKPGGSLLIFVPDMKKLAGRWLSGEIDDYIFMVNAYGAFQGEEGDRHRWGFSRTYLIDTISSVLNNVAYDCGNYQGCIEFDWRDIPGADIAKDWWILGIEVIKS